MPTPKFRIVCTEDDADTRDLIVVLLNGHNLEVVTSASSTESMDLARNQRFDLYLLDNWLPGSSGIDLSGIEKVRLKDSDTFLLRSGLR
jgi:DNA-binding response OmpR family regulator